MALKILEFISILLMALVAGVFWGPWLALSRSLAMFQPEALIEIVKRMSANLARAMTVLMPATILSMLPVLYLSYAGSPSTFYFTLAGLILLIVALLTTVLIEVPIVKRIDTWTMSTFAENWRELRDRWLSFHMIRILAGVGGLAALVAGAIF